MSPRPKVLGPQKLLGIRIDAEVSDALDRVCHEQGFIKGRAVQRAIVDWLLEHDEDYGRVGLDPAMDADR